MWKVKNDGSNDVCLERHLTLSSYQNRIIAEDILYEVENIGNFICSRSERGQTLKITEYIYTRGTSFLLLLMYVFIPYINAEDILDEVENIENFICSRSEKGQTLKITEYIYIYTHEGYSVFSFIKVCLYRIY